MKSIFLISAIVTSVWLSAQPSWTLWASGLPGGVFPKMAVAPNHDIFYGLEGSGGTPGILYKANTASVNGSFAAMPAIPVPASLTNNIMTIVCNNNSEPIAGIFRSSSADPFLFKYSNTTNTWDSSVVDFLPNLGAFCSAKAPNGDLYVGAKWSYIYKSTDDGATFHRIDETPIVQAAYPCYYPTWGASNPGDGAIYSINVDANGRVYAGTEGAGVIFSDDGGVHWQPADFRACQASNNTLKDSTSPMEPITNTGNLGAIGFTSSNNVIFNGTQMWTFNWNSCLGLADMTAHTVTQSSGFMQYFIGSGLQVTKIVTTANGNIFLHSGSNTSVSGTIGIYTSIDGINWTLFNTGITSTQTGQAQGSLAVDGNKVFMATTDGKVWMYDADTTGTSNGINEIGNNFTFQAYPNPSSGIITISLQNQSTGKSINSKLTDLAGRIIIDENLSISGSNNSAQLDASAVSDGMYFIILNHDGISSTQQVAIRK